MESVLGNGRSVFTDSHGYEIVGHGFAPLFLCYRHVKPFVPPIPPCDPNSVGVNSRVEQNQIKQNLFNPVTRFDTLGSQLKFF